MECLTDKVQNRRMALSYMQESQITAGLLTGHNLGMKQESSEKRHRQQPSPLLNNNNNTASSAASLFSGMGAAAAAAASLSILSPEQLLAASHMSHALLAASLPLSLNANLAVTNPNLYTHHQIFCSWAPPSASSPPHRSPGPVSPALSTKSGHSARGHHTSNNNNISINNNNNSSNNNNVVSSSGDRMNKKAQANLRKRAAKIAKTSLEAGTQAVTRYQQQQITSIEGAPSPTSSASPEAGKDSRDKVFTCGVCSRSFGYKHVLQNHERTHTGEKPFKCPECHKRFTRDHHLKTHMRLHTGEKPYHCNHCDRQFVQVANLRRHLRVHTGERPYSCDVCVAKFSDSNQLKAHVLIHKNEKPFQCEHCQIRFRRRHHLVHHKCGSGGGSGNNSASIIPASLVSAQLGRTNHTASPSIACSDDLQDDIDVDVDVEMGESSLITRYKQNPATLRRNTVPAMLQLPSPTTIVGTSPAIPFNLPGIPADLPEQTEPEDLSMSKTRIRDPRELGFGHHHQMMLQRPHSHSHSSGGGSPMSRSPSSDIVHEEEEEDDVEDLDVARASPSSLFAPDTRRIR